jgi:Glycosyltransferase
LSSHANIYNDYLFRKVAEDTQLNIEVYFNSDIKSSHPWKGKMGQGFSHQVLNRKFIIDFPLLYKVLFRSQNSVIVVAGWSQLNFLTITILLGLFNRSFVFWTDTPNIERPRNKIKSVIRNGYLNFLFKKVKYFMVTGRIGVETAKQMGVPLRKLISFPFATDIDYFTPLVSEQSCTVPIKMLSVGRLDMAHKGHDLAIKALSLLRANGFTGFTFEIAGTGPDELKLKELIRNENLDKYVKLLGWKEPQEIRELYRNSDVLLHTSHFDPFPNAVLEAMACGMIIIGSSKAGSVSDRVTDGYNGYVHVSGDLSDIHRCINIMCTKNKRELLEMKRNSRETAEQWPIDYNLRELKKICGNG